LSRGLGFSALTTDRRPTASSQEPTPVTSLLVDLGAWASATLPHVLAAALLLIAGLWIGNWAGRTIAHVLERQVWLDLTFRGIVSTLVRYAIILVAVIAALQQLGFETTSIIAGLGAILIAVGLALQGTLSNIAAGLLLLWLRPFRVGDLIETATVAGTVKDVGLFATEVIRADGVYLFVPNSELWSKPLANPSRMPARMVEVRFTIKKPSEVPLARERLLALAAAEELVDKQPPPVVLATAITDVGVVISLNVWTAPANHRRLAALLAEGGAAGLAEL
jgi:small conductance mechanosensitive channel